MLKRLVSNIRFTNPQPNRIVIIHQHDYWLKHLILKDLPSTTLGVYPDNCVIHVTPMLIWRLLFRLCFIDWAGSLKAMACRNLFTQLYRQYMLACLDQMKARVVLTFIDNSVFFQNLSRLDEKRIYFAIQNGTRTLACVRDSLPSQPHPHSRISMTNFFCFGQRDIDLFASHGHEIRNYFPVGALLGGYYKSEMSAENVEQQFDLCLISQWHEHFFEELSGNDFPAQFARRVGASINGLISLLQRLLKETGLRMVICRRGDRGEAEATFYKKAFGEEVQIIERDRETFSSYRAIDKSRLVIALNSTILLEAFSWGQKVLWCNASGDIHYEMPEAGISYHHGDDYDEFKSRVLTLLNMPQEDYRMQTRDRARHINNYDPLNPPHKIIRAAVIEAIST